MPDVYSPPRNKLIFSHDIGGKFSTLMFPECQKYKTFSQELHIILIPFFWLLHLRFLKHVFLSLMTFCLEAVVRNYHVIVDMYFPERNIVLT